MTEKIAVATVSGKAYYHLVNALKARGVAFLSLTPYESIPVNIKVVITTEKERKLINHPNAIVFEEATDPATIVTEAIRRTKGKRNPDTITIGVDPGKSFGMAVLSNGTVLERTVHSSVTQTINAVFDVLTNNSATRYTVKVGNGAPEYATELLSRLDEALPKDVEIEIVSEAGTSRFAKDAVHPRGLRDALSAVKIAERRGRIFRRAKEKEQ